MIIILAQSFSLGKFLLIKFFSITHLKINYLSTMPIFKCIFCKIDIERSRKVFIKNKGHLLCSSCQDKYPNRTSYGDNRITKISF